jgi:hypothetical protein
MERQVVRPLQIMERAFRLLRDGKSVGKDDWRSSFDCSAEIENDCARLEQPTMRQRAD